MAACELITEQGRIDGQLDTQIDRIAEELLTTSDKDEKKVIAQAGLVPQEEKTKDAYLRLNYFPWRISI